MHLFDLSRGYFRTNLRTNITCFDEVAHPGAWGLLRPLWAYAASRPLLGASASPGHLPGSSARTTLPDGHLKACAQSNNPQLVNQRPAAPLDGGELTYPFWEVCTNSQPTWSLPKLLKEQKPSLTDMAPWSQAGGRQASAAAQAPVEASPNPASQRTPSGTEQISPPSSRGLGSR